MKRRHIRAAAAAISMTAVLSATGCAGALGNVLGGSPGMGGSTISGEVNYVDTRYQEVEVRESNGQIVRLGYDSQTDVYYQSNRYSPTSLEQGDQVLATVQKSSADNVDYYASRIDVQQSVQDRGGSGGSVNTQVVSGTVQSVDARNGTFSMQTSNGQRLTVFMPYRATQTDAARFDRLRRGDYVSAEVEWIASDQARLVRFQ